MWVNFLALNVDYVLRTGAFDPAKGGSNPPNSVCSGEQRLFVYLFSGLQRTGILISNDTRWCSAISGSPLPE